MSARVLVIAEAGVNHNGSRATALRLIDAAADAGADVVKFQTFRAQSLVTATVAKASYQVENTRDAGAQFEMLRGLELSEADHHALAERCHARGIRFMSTAFDRAGLAFLATFDMPAVKVPSGDLTCAPLLLQAARLGTPLLISTGMATIGEIEQALGVVAFGITSRGEPRDGTEFAEAYYSPAGRAALTDRVTLLHCVTQYPAPASSANLRAIETMRRAFGLAVGYSDHTLGIEVPLAAVALGATVLEKHFTLDRTMPGPDHAASLEPAELARMVNGIRTVEASLGSEWKGPQPEELANRPIARRSLVAARAIALGTRFSAADIDIKRPGTGVSPMEFWRMIGREATRDYAPDELLEW